MSVETFRYDNSIVKNFAYATMLWGVVGMFSEAASDEKGFVLNNKRLQWCSKKLEEYCSRLSEEMVILKNVIEQKTLPIDS